MSPNYPDTLSPDLWAAIARSALAADGDSVQAWCRLSLVSRAFRDAIAGELTLGTGVVLRHSICWGPPLLLCLAGTAVLSFLARPLLIAHTA